MKPSVDFSRRHRAAVLRRERYRLTLERVLGWRLSASYQRARTFYRRWRHASLVSQIFKTLLQWYDPYRHWVRKEARLISLVTTLHTEELPAVPRPMVSILMLVQDPHVPWLEEAISSVRAQQYPHWELLLCLVHASPEAVARIETHQALDERIKHLSRPETADAATVLNAGLRMAAGDFLGFLRQHDTIAPYALSAVVRRLEAAEVDIVYSDEDVIDAEGRRSAPFFKPDWSPDLCLSSLYACRFGIYRRDLVMAGGGIHPESIDSVEYDLLLRCTERSERIAHIPLVLYHKRHLDHTQRITGSPKAGSAETQPRLWDDSGQETLHESAKRALAAALARRGESAEVVDGPGPCTFRVRRRLHGTPLVSILIPTRDQVQLLQR
ncbi:MAG: glycosyltransferase, partial [Candidatus Binatia bacterium]|nr:glycosyltransferase [Candidatus Binatia bacterium]